MDDSELSVLITKHAPYIYFHKKEKYMPSSFEHIVKHSNIKDEGKTNFPINSVTQVRESIIQELEDETSNLIWQAGEKRGLLINIGEKDADDGYKGSPDTEHRFFGDPMAPTQYIHAYTQGVNVMGDSTKYIDITYAVYFIWNGTRQSHAMDVEYITLRLQYFNSNGSYAYNNVQSNSMLPKNKMHTWAIVRMYLSSHGNGMWYPTHIKGEINETKIELDGTHPVVYSALVSHALYPQAKTYKRFFGFGDDVTQRGNLWKPTHIALWNPIFNFDQQGNSSRGDLYVLDVQTAKIQENVDPLLYLSFFNGTMGSMKNNQSTLPFGKNINLMSAGDAYYKFQYGGANAVVKTGLSESTRNILLYICYLTLILSIVYTIYNFSTTNSKTTVFFSSIHALIFAFVSVLITLLRVIN